MGTLKTIKMQFAKVLVALAAGAAAFTAPTASKVSKVVVRGENPNEDGKLGAGGMADTRDPEPFVNETDKRQSISQAPSFEEYLKSRQFAAYSRKTELKHGLFSMLAASRLPLQAT